MVSWLVIFQAESSARPSIVGGLNVGTHDNTSLDNALFENGRMHSNKIVLNSIFGPITVFSNYPAAVFEQSAFLQIT